LDVDLNNGIKILAGASLLDVFSKQNNKLIRPLLTEKWMGTWGISYELTSSHVTLDYTGNIYGPMRLPLLSDSDPRSEYSPVWSLQNIQLTYKGFKKLEIYAGVKNLLNWKPGKNEPFLIANSRDPFDNNVQRDALGGVIVSPENPYALSFDPGYVYAPNQGIRAFLGLRITLR